MIDIHPKVAQPPLVSDDGLLRVCEPRRDEHGAIWLGLAGEGDLPSIKVLKRALAGAGGAGHVHIDTSRLEFMDLASARYLIAEHGQAVELAA